MCSRIPSFHSFLLMIVIRPLCSVGVPPEALVHSYHQGVVPKTLAHISLWVTSKREASALNHTSLIARTGHGSDGNISGSPQGATLSIIIAYLCMPRLLLRTWGAFTTSHLHQKHQKFWTGLLVCSCAGFRIQCSIECMAITEKPNKTWPRTRASWYVSRLLNIISFCALGALQQSTCSVCIPYGNTARLLTIIRLRVVHDGPLFGHSSSTWYRMLGPEMWFPI